MAGACKKTHPLPRPGIRQADRTVPALDPAKLQLEDRGQREWLEFAQKLSTHIRFQALVDESPESSEQNWEQFFGAFNFAGYRQAQGDFDKDLKRFSQSPHGGLYSVYLRLLKRLRDDLNRLPASHLDFYYEDVLQLKPRNAVTDKVHVVFEAARKKDQIRIPAGTKLNAGKLITYKTDNEFFVGQARVAFLHSIFSDPNATDRPRYAIQADSLDGYGEPLTEEQPNWKPFGAAALPVMELGFAVASPILTLKEGDRTITMKVEMRSAIKAQDLPPDDILKSSLAAEFSGEEEWLGPFEAESASLTVPAKNQVNLTLKLSVNAAEDPIGFYDVSKLEGGFDTVSPILKVMLKESSDPRVQRLFAGSSVNAIQITVDVIGAKELDLENDLGRLNTDKPFMPFGPQPVRGSSFYISNEEMLSKQVTDFKIQVKWQDVPTNLADRYSAYLGSKIDNRAPALVRDDLKASSDRMVKNNSYFTASMTHVKSAKDDVSIPVQLFHKDDARLVADFDSSAEVRPTIGRTYAEFANYFSRVRISVKALFPGSVRLIKLSTSPISRIRKRRMLRKKIDRRIRVPSRQIRRFSIKKRKLGVIRVSLNQHFFHRLYPHYLSATIADESSTISPQEPYTPKIESIGMDYSASLRYDKFGKDEFSEYNKKTIQIFHITPFGHAEQHAMLKGDLPFVTDKNVYLVPDYQDAGSLILGIENLEEQQSISFLLQLAQGTANPLKQRQQVQWSLLVRNHWRPFDQSEVLVDETNKLLATGIVRLSIPGEPLHDNTLFNPDLTWLRASVASDVDAVCDFKAVYLHAVSALVAQTHEEDNASGTIAADTISKLHTPIAAIKAVSQPFGSFGGRSAESKLEFYRRVSERLRHKKRAITSVDYERLVLEEFPQLHMVRCLTHTDTRSCTSPGNVALIVIPKTPPQARFDRLRPRVDLDTLSKIEDYINSLNSFQVTAEVRNPSYEDIYLTFSIQFQSDKPFTPYQGILNEDLIRFLSPWMADAEILPAFGGRLHKSQIIKFIEELDYVDFVADVKLFRGQQSTSDLTSISPSSPDAILVSNSRHDIQAAGGRS